MKTRVLNYFRQHDRGWVFALFGMACLVYLPYSGNPLVFDDLPFFSSSISHFATSSFHFDLRWLPYATLGWTWAFFVDSPVAYRLGNTFLHAANGVLLFYFLRQLVVLYSPPGEAAKGMATRGAWVGALFFVCSPVAVYATGYLVQRSTLMATLFMLVMLLAYLKGLLSGKKRWLLVSVIAYFMAFFSKEHSAMAPAIAVMLSILLGSRRQVSKISLGATWAAFAAIGVYGVLRVKGLIGVPYEAVFEVHGADSYFTQYGLDSVPPALLHVLSMLTQADLFFKYLLLWFLPNPAWLSVDIRVAFVNSVLGWRAWIAAVAFIAYGLVAARLLLRHDKRSLVGFALLYPWLMFLVEFSSIRVQEPFVLYRSYLWLPGMMLLITLMAIQLMRRQLTLLMFTMALVLTPLAWNRLWTFSDPYLLWNDAALLLKNKHEVGSDRIYYNRGNAELSQKKWDMAIADYNRVIANNPKVQPAYMNLGLAYYGLKRYDEAINEFSKAITLNPRDAQAYYSKGISYKRLHNDAAALEQIKISCTLGNMMGCAVVAANAQRVIHEHPPK
jgi:tetratricopeptide (TPR) repeat protein